jgi:hypothetical protein
MKLKYVAHRLYPYFSGKNHDARDAEEFRAETDAIGGPAPEPELTGEARLSKKDLRERVFRDGKEDAESGMYDQWTFSTGTTPPYLVALRNQRDEILNENKIRRLRDLQRVEQRIAAAEAAAEEATERTAEAQAKLTAAKEHEAKVQKVLDGEVPDDHPGRRWAEPAHSLSRRRVIRLFRALVMLTFAGVELPIQYSTFIYFGESRPLTLAFVVGTATAMLVAPHQAGGWARKAKVEGGQRELRFAACFVMAAWVVALVLLADLRRRTLLAPLPDTETGTSVPAPVTTLHLTPVMVTALFLGLMALTGTVAFVFGYQSENPYTAELASAQAKRRALARQAAKAKGRLTAMVRAAEKVQDREAKLTARWEARDAAVAEFFAACAARYRHGVALMLGDPAVSEAVGEPR